MDEIFTITDPGWNWINTFWWSLPAILVLFGIGLSFILWKNIAGRARQRFWRDTAGVLGVTFAFVAVVGFCGSFVGGDSLYEDDMYAAKVEAIENLGYSNVDLSGSKFTAEQDGEYFHGGLIFRTDEGGELTYQVAELVDLDN